VCVRARARVRERGERERGKERHAHNHALNLIQTAAAEGSERPAQHLGRSLEVGDRINPTTVQKKERGGKKPLGIGLKLLRGSAPYSWEKKGLTRGPSLPL